MPKTNLKVMLLSHTPDPDGLVTKAAKLCYSNKTIEEIQNDLEKSPEKNAQFVKMLADLGHGSPFEHVSFTFGIEGVSRALTHQLVRHRIASYSQKSQRYVTEGKFDYVIPPSVEACGNPKAQEIYERSMEMLQNNYNYLVNDCGVPKEDARMLLPNACETKIIVTMNARSLFNFFHHRCCLRAQWEIRAMANQMKKLVKEVAPAIFKITGAHCETLGYCPEGKMSCGRFPTLEKIKSK